MTDGPLYFRTASGASINLDGWMQGQSVFLILGGPSLLDMNLELLRKPGIATWSVNNSWSVIRPRFWTCVDPPDRFCSEGWMDPSVIKFVPEGVSNSFLAVKDPAGKFHRSTRRAANAPGVFFFPRNEAFEPADFLTQNSVCWGGPRKQTDAVGVKGFPSVMLATLRLCHAVGFRRVYLCGATFSMEREKPGYAFEQDRSKFAVDHNNRLFEALTKRFEALKPYWDLEGFQVFNATPETHLHVFPKIKLADAVREALKSCGDMSPARWYSKPAEPKPTKPADEVGFLRVAGE